MDRREWLRLNGKRQDEDREKLREAYRRLILGESSEPEQESDETHNNSCEGSKEKLTG